MTLHDEIAAEMHAYATAETGGLDPLTYLRWRAPGPVEPEPLTERERTARKEEKRREKRGRDAAFREHERARWQRANEARAERKRAAAYEAAQRALAEEMRIEALSRLHPPPAQQGGWLASTSDRPTRPAT